MAAELGFFLGEPPDMDPAARRVHLLRGWELKPLAPLSPAVDIQGAQFAGDAPAPQGFPFVYPETVNNIIDGGRDYNDGHPPATITWAGREIPNPAKDSVRQAYLGTEQKAWLLDQLRTSGKPWKIWGHSFATMRWRKVNTLGSLGSTVASIQWLSGVPNVSTRVKFSSASARLGASGRGLSILK